MAFSQEFVIVDKAQHDLKKFNCGKPEMDTYLARFAVKNMQLGLSRTWVLPIANEDPEIQKTRVAAYYALASSTVASLFPPIKLYLGILCPLYFLRGSQLIKNFQGCDLAKKH